MKRQTRILTGFLLSLLVVQLPFIFFMPFHIDDAIFLSITRNIEQHPLTPLMQPVVWEGQLWSDMMSYPHPPLVCYYIYLLEKIAPANPEPVVHLGFVVFFWLLATALFFLFRFLRAPPLLGAAIAVFSPVVFVSSHTIMMDVPTLAVGLAGVVMALYGARDNRVRRTAGGGILIGLAILISYSAILFLLPPALYLLASPGQRRQLLVLGLPPTLIFCGWLGLIWLTTGRFLVTDVLGLLANYRARPNRDLFSRLVYNLSMTGGTFLFPLVLLIWQIRRVRGKLYLIGGLMLGFLIRLHLPDEGGGHQLAITLLATAGAILLIEAVVVAVRCFRANVDGDRRIWLALAVWVPVFYLVTLILYPCGAARYQIWLVPPLIGLFLVSFRSVEGNGGGIMRHKLLLTLLLVGQAGMAFVTATADMELARAYRSAVGAIVSHFAPESPRMWVASDWGLRHYILAAGGRTILRYDRRPRPGDILIKPALTAPTYTTHYEDSPYSTRVFGVTMRPLLPFGVLNPLIRAGFYSDYWGFVPVWWNPERVPLAMISVYRITRTLPPSPRMNQENTGYLRSGSLDEIPP